MQVDLFFTPDLELHYRQHRHCGFVLGLAAPGAPLVLMHAAHAAVLLYRSRSLWLVTLRGGLQPI